VGTRLLISTGERTKNVTAKFLTKHMAYVKVSYIFFLVCAQQHLPKYTIS